jgi:hypothetical protein
LLLAGFIISLTGVKAQTEPYLCNPDCDSSEWSAPITNIFTLPGGCQIEVIYTFRHGCDGMFQDIQILSIKELNANCVFDWEQLFKTAFREIIKQNSMGFNPQVGTTGCDQTWRVSAASCWIFVIMSGDPHDPTPRKVMMPCEFADCCLQPLQVCREQNPNPPPPDIVTITPLGDPSPVNDCAQAQPRKGYETNNCNPTCQWLWLTLYPRVGSQEEKSENKVLVNDLRVSFADNSDLLDVIFNAQSEIGKLSVKVTDLQGNSMSEKSENVKTGENSIKINTSKFHTGIYIYSIYLNGIMVKSEKISIVR